MGDLERARVARPMPDQVRVKAAKPIRESSPTAPSVFPFGCFGDSGSSAIALSHLTAFTSGTKSPRISSYSFLMTASGSMRVARSVGMVQAASATTAITPIATTYV